MNQLADNESRIISDSSEWALDIQIFQKLMEIRGPCTVDPFASRLSVKLQILQSPRRRWGVMPFHLSVWSGDVLQDQIRRVPLGPTDHPFMEITNLVSTLPGNVSGISSFSPHQQQTSQEPRRDIAPHGPTRPSSTSRLLVILSRTEASYYTVVCTNKRCLLPSSPTTEIHWYTGRWDVKGVLKSNREKSIKDVTHKLTMLMVPSNADRASDLYALDIRYLSLLSEGASFRLASLSLQGQTDKLLHST